MDDLMKEKEKNISNLEIKEEELSHELSVEEKKRLIRQARQDGGKNWKKIFGIFRSVKPDMDTVHDLYGMNLGSLKDYNDPSKMRDRR